MLDLHKQIEQALQGSAEQQYYLGLRYYLGDDVIQDYKSALALFTQSAEQGFNNAQLHLALLYYEGHGVEKNFQLAFLWFTKASATGNIWAHFYVSLHCCPVNFNL